MNSKDPQYSASRPDPSPYSDQHYMLRAIELARKGRYTTAPNPNVGCVIVKAQRVIGEGFHLRAGEPHAEVHALRQAGAEAQGATCYVTLEPCSHYGRTPPCASALIKAGVAKVVVGMVDPNPKVAGRGIAMLQEAGIEVVTGVLAEEAEALNPGFCRRMRDKRPLVRVKMAATLDGGTALENGKSQWITGPAARADVQRWRAQSSAILSTAETVLADNAALNVRWQELGSAQTHYQALGLDECDLRQPLRVIIDSQNRLTPDLKLFSQPGPILLLRANLAGEWPAQVKQVSIPTVTHTDKVQLDLHAMLSVLAQQDVNELWVEAGASLAGALLADALVDEIILYQAPKLMGSRARGIFALPALTEMAQVIDLTLMDVRQVGADLRMIVKPIVKPVY